MKAEHITVLLLAGGKSERFWPLGDKVSISFSGSTLLERHIETFEQLGVEKIIVVVRKGTQLARGLYNKVCFLNKVEMIEANRNSKNEHPNEGKGERKNQ